MAARRILAACDMPAESRGAAALDGGHDLELAEAHMAGIGATPSGPVAAEDVRDLQSGPNHDARYAGGLSPGRCSGVSRSSGLMTARIVLVATRV